MHKGSCHCGRISFEVDGEFSEVKECNCSHCSRKGYLLWFVPHQSFRLKSGEGEYSTYLFNKHVISHNFCKTCGWHRSPRASRRTVRKRRPSMFGVWRMSISRL